MWREEGRRGERKEKKKDTGFMSELSLFFSLSLLGPRRKLSLAIAGLKEKEDDDPRKAASATGAETLGRGEEGWRGGGGEVRGRGGGQEGEGSSSGGGRGRGRSSRPPLYKQPSTELQAAYHQVCPSSNCIITC